MLLSSLTKTAEASFASYCRGRDKEVIPGAREDRIGEYRRLTYNIIDSTLQRAFPVTKEVLGERDWDKLVDDFFREYDSSPPYLWKMPEGLEIYVRNTGYGEKLGKPFLADLLLFEWIEIEVSMMVDGSVSENIEYGDLQSGIPVLNPDYRIIELAYPVHKLSAEESTKAKGNYIVLCYRNRESYEVSYAELVPFAATVLENIREMKTTGREAISLALTQYPEVPLQLLYSFAVEFLEKLSEQGMILGIRG